MPHMNRPTDIPGPQTLGDGWEKAADGDKRKTFHFPSSVHVLAFALRARQLADDAALTVDVKELAGRSVVTLRRADLDRSEVPTLAARLNAAAAAIANGKDGPE